MKQMVMNGAAPFLPEEIIVNILKRLPVKSLMRFQCVCKLWKNLLKIPYFIADHLRHSSHHNTSLLFFPSYGGDSLKLRLLDSELQVRDVQKAPSFDCLRRDSVSIIGSSNGLLCVAITKSYTSPPSLLLWNPATRDVREVPRSRTIRSVVYNCFLGFSFSKFVNDYKIVALYDECDAMVCKAEVYSLSRDSWKEIEFGNLGDVGLFPGSVSTTGAIFWYASKSGEEEVGDDGLEEEEEEEDDDPVIVSFDIVMEVLTLIPWPPFSAKLDFNFTVYEDKLAMLVDHGIGFFPDIDLWVMEVDIGSSGERRSWTKKFTRGPCPWASSRPGIIWMDQIVMSVTDETEFGIGKHEPESSLCMFNVVTNEFKCVVNPRNYFCCEFLNYVESLVPAISIHNIEEP